MKIYTPREVLFRAKGLTNDKYDGEFAERIGVQKQSLSQYKNKNSVDVQLRIISLLLDIIADKNTNK